MNEETIFVQTDPVFNIVLQSLAELRNQNRLQVTHVQAATLTDIQSNDDDEDRRFMFGGEQPELANSAFGRTASAVVRMCMLEAAGVPRHFWPTLGPNTGRRNKNNLQNPIRDDENQPLERTFPLANNRGTARRYWSKYDHIYPHFRIEDEINDVSLHEQVSMPSMMLIFRGNFTEVVEITTTFTATPRGDQQFASYIHVVCIVREIASSSESCNDKEFTRQLKELMVPVEIQKDYFEEIIFKVKKNGLIPLQLPVGEFATMIVGDKNEQLENR